jgi:hypothetical protein
MPRTAVLNLLVEHINRDGFPCEIPQHKRRNKIPGRWRHCYAHVGSALPQCTHNQRRFICCDASTDTKQNVFVAEMIHRLQNNVRCLLCEQTADSSVSVRFVSR